MDFGSAAGRHVRTRALMKTVWNICTALYFCSELHWLKKPPWYCRYCFLALYRGHGKYSHLAGIIQCFPSTAPTLVCVCWHQASRRHKVSRALFFFIISWGKRWRRIRWGTKGGGVRWGSWWGEKKLWEGTQIEASVCGVWSGDLESCGVCSYTTELNNRGLNTSPARKQSLSCFYIITTT